MKKESKIILSERLCSVAAMVSIGNRVCDVGCDHGYVSIYLVQNQISPKVIAMDVNEGPLKAAKENVEVYGLEHYIETRRSDGLASLSSGEVDTVICAGMGGLLMKRIIQEGSGKITSLKEMILQPQSAVKELREYLREEGYTIVKEDMVLEDGKYYPIIGVVVPSNHGQYAQGEDRNAIKQTMEDKFGRYLLEKRHPVLKVYLKRERRICNEILENLKNAQDNDARAKAKQKETLAHIKDIDMALATMGGCI